MNSTIPELAKQDYSWFFNSANSWIGFVSGAVVILGVIGYLLTKPRSTQSIEDDWYHFTRRLQITIINIELKFANNPLFRSFKLFSYNGEGEFDVSGHIIPLPNNIYEKKKKNECIVEVHVKEKSLLKHNTVSKLKIVLERKKDDYAEKISHEFSSDKVVVTNSNDIPVRNYKILLPSHLTKNNIENLEKDSRVDDVFEEDGKQYMTIKEINRKTVSGTHKEIFRF